MKDTAQPPQQADTPARRAMLLGGVLLAVVLLVFGLGKLGILPSGEAMTAGWTAWPTVPGACRR
jgi:hypothetical protein